MKNVIREATKNDIPTILRLVRELADYENLSHECVATEQSIHDLLFGKDAVAEAVIAESDGYAAGFALFFHNCSTFAGKRGIYLEDLYVRPDLRGRGIGKSLLLHVVAIAKERDCARVEWAALDWNTPAVEFYKNLGAEPLDDWTLFRLTDNAMGKILLP